MRGEPGRSRSVPGNARRSLRRSRPRLRGARRCVRGGRHHATAREADPGLRVPRAFRGQRPAATLSRSDPLLADHASEPSVPGARDARHRAAITGDADMSNSPLAGQPAPPSALVDVAKLVTAYYANRPDPSRPEQRIAFGTSGHRGSSFEHTFNEQHVLGVTQAICLYRRAQNIDGPLFLGIDTHGLSRPASMTALEVLAANGVNVMIAPDDGYTPTPAISHAILTYNRDRKTALADGIVITPSHNPPHSGGSKSNPPTGGPADVDATKWIEAKANALLADGLKDIRRVSFETALNASTTHRHDYLSAYVGDLGNVID